MEQGMTAKVTRARECFRAGSTRGIEGRRESLSRLEKVLIGKREEVLEALAEDLGKPGLEAYLSEYHFLLQEIRFVRKLSLIHI